MNYGELPGTVSGDGRPVDAYLVGWDVPLRVAEGPVVALLLRADDREDELVVARPGTTWTEEGVLRAVHFQERYFRTRLVLWPGAAG